MAEKDTGWEADCTHTKHTGWPLPLAWFTLALGVGSEGDNVGPELWADL